MAGLAQAWRRPPANKPPRRPVAADDQLIALNLELQHQCSEGQTARPRPQTLINSIMPSLPWTGFLVLCNQKWVGALKLDVSQVTKQTTTNGRPPRKKKKVGACIDWLAHCHFITGKARLIWTTLLLLVGVIPSRLDWMVDGMSKWCLLDLEGATHPRGIPLDTSTPRKCAPEKRGVHVPFCLSVRSDSG